ncbi:hypothetical protein BH09VER1_BH09VER1_19000 [soil metagenome]
MSKKKGSKKHKEEKPASEETEVQETTPEHAVVEETVVAESEPKVEEPGVEDQAIEESPPPNEEPTEEQSAAAEQGEEVPSTEAVSLDDLLDEPAEESPAVDQPATERELFEGEAPAESEEEIPEIISSVPLKHIVEAILFASQKPVSAKELVTILKGAAEADKENPDSPALPFAKIKPEALRAAVEELRVERQEPTSTYEVRENAAGWQLVTKGDYSPWLRQLFPENRSARISAPAMETLAIIAYRQPITRADLEAVRGVAVDGVMQTLLDRSLIKIAGRAEIPGRPLLYETTQHFMEHFGLTNLDDLPNATELRKISLPKAPAPEEPAATPAPIAAEASVTEPAVAEAATAGSTVNEIDIEGSTASPEAYFGEQPPIEEAPAEELAEAALEIAVENAEPTEEAPEKSDTHENT